jgi:hypothetical protein
MMTVFYIVLGIGLGIAVFFPCAALLGFYDDRDGGYRFRTVRYFTVVGIISLIPVCGVFILMFAVGATLSESQKMAETAIARNRAQQLHIQDDLSVIFPDYLNAQTEPCYTSAISNYVEDQWGRSYREETCKLGAPYCANTEKDFYDLARYQRNPNNFPLLDLDPIGFMMGTVQTAARNMYGTVRSFQGIIDPRSVGRSEVGANAQNYEIYRQYFLKCTTLQPEPWITPGAAVVKRPSHLCIGSCP